MLESELHDREFNDKATDGRDAGELTPSVPAAVFQPPQVVFQTPTVHPEPERAPGSSEPAGTDPGTPADANDGADAGTSGDDDGPGRRRRRRPSRGRGRSGDGDAAAEAGDAQPESQGAGEPQGTQGPAADTGNSGAQPEGRRPSSRTRSRRGS